MQDYAKEQHFNSTMVWLEGKLDPTIWIYPLRFQFHYGLIRSPIYRSISDGYYKFQFHYGLIRSERTRNPYTFINNFNSTMVWLEERKRGDMMT